MCWQVSELQTWTSNLVYYFPALFCCFVFCLLFFPCTVVILPVPRSIPVALSCRLDIYFEILRVFPQWVFFFSYSFVYMHRCGCGGGGGCVCVFALAHVCVCLVDISKDCTLPMGWASSTVEPVAKLCAMLGKLSSCLTLLCLALHLSFEFLWVLSYFFVICHSLVSSGLPLSSYLLLSTWRISLWERCSDSSLKIVWLLLPSASLGLVIIYAVW